MTKSYDYPAAEHIDSIDIERMRNAWAHLTLLASGQPPATSNAEAAQMLADAFHNITGEDIQSPTAKATA